MPFIIAPLIQLAAVAGTSARVHQAGVEVLSILYGRDVCAGNDILPTFELQTLRVVTLSSGTERVNKPGAAPVSHRRSRTIRKNSRDLIRTTINHEIHDLIAPFCAAAGQASRAKCQTPDLGSAPHTPLFATCGRTPTRAPHPRPPAHPSASAACNAPSGPSPAAPASQSIASWKAPARRYRPHAGDDGIRNRQHPDLRGAPTSTTVSKQPPHSFPSARSARATGCRSPRPA